MIRLRDSLRLTRTKFHTRKFRSIFATFSLSLALIIILVFMIGGGGILNFAKKTFKDSLRDRYFASEEFIPTTTGVDTGNGDGAFSTSSVSQEYDQDKPQPPVDPNEYLKKYTGNGVKSVYVQKNIDPYQPMYSFEGEKYTKMGSRMTLTAIDSLFAQDFIYDGFTFENTYDGKIPVIIPKDFILTAEDSANTMQPTEEQYRVLQEHSAAYIGKTFKLVTIVDSGVPDANGNWVTKTTITPTDIEAIVVGITQSGLGGGGYMQSFGFTIPSWALDTQQTLKAKAPFATTRLIYEFDTQKHRDDFVKTSYEKMRTAAQNGGEFVMSPSVISPVFGPYEMFRQFLKYTRYTIMAIGGFFLIVSAFSLMSTIGKIVNDSKQEIGVFRATGAQRSDIRKIYFTYTLTLAIIAYIFALIMAYGFLILASVKWAKQIFYSIAGFGTATDVPLPQFLFISFPVLLLLGFFAFAVLFGILASLIPVYRASRLDPVKVLREF